MTTKHKHFIDLSDDDKIVAFESPLGMIIAHNASRDPFYNSELWLVNLVRNGVMYHDAIILAHPFAKPKGIYKEYLAQR
jgi:hypothetical protein